MIHGRFPASSAEAATQQFAAERYGCDYQTAISQKLIDPADLVITFVNVKKGQL